MNKLVMLSITIAVVAACHRIVNDGLTIERSYNEIAELRQQVSTLQHEIDSNKATELDSVALQDQLLKDSVTRPEPHDDGYVNEMSREDSISIMVETKKRLYTSYNRIIPSYKKGRFYNEDLN